MGHGGIDPTYFLDEMTWVEILLYLKGLDKRTRSIYDSMRIQTANILSGIGAKMKDGSAIQPSSIYPFPEDEEKTHIETEEEKTKKHDKLVALLRACKADNSSGNSR